MNFKRKSSVNEFFPFFIEKYLHNFCEKVCYIRVKYIPLLSIT